MTVTVYASTDGSAPVLTGSVGTLLTVLDAVLVNGYGAKSAAGWTKPFSNSGNVGCYRNSAVHGTGFRLNVDDSGPGAAGAKEARMTGFETMSALSTGTGQFPTSGQLAIGAGSVVLRKSTTADATARAWTIVADDTVFYFFAETGDLVNVLTITYPFMFGDFFSEKASDPYNCAIIGTNAENAGGTINTGFSAGNSFSNQYLTDTIIGHYVARSWTGIGGAQSFGKHIDFAKMGTLGSTGTSRGNTSLASITSGMGFNLQNPLCFPFPNGPDGGLWLSPVWVHHSGSVRGYLKGLWAPLHDMPLNHNDTYSGSGNMSGKSFLVQKIPASFGGTASGAEAHLETSNTWS